MECPQAPWIFKGLDQLDEAMCMYLNDHGISQRKAPRGMDSPATGHQAGVLARAPLIHPSGRYIGYQRGAAMYPRLSRRIPNHRQTGGHSIATILRRHHVLLARIDGHGAPRLHHAGHILGLLGSAAKYMEVLGRQHQLVLGGINPDLCSAGHTHHLAPHPLPRASSG